MKNVDKDFLLLDLKQTKEKFEFISVKITGRTLYIISKHDEWYIRYDEKIEAFILHHKNTKHITRRFHREHMKFDGVFHILEYICSHDKKSFHKSKKQLKMEQLFKKIAQ